MHSVSTITAKDQDLPGQVGKEQHLERKLLAGRKKVKSVIKRGGQSSERGLSSCSKGEKENLNDDHAEAMRRRIRLQTVEMILKQGEKR